MFSAAALPGTQGFVHRSLTGLFGIFPGAAIEFALNQAFQKFGHSDVIILRHFQYKNLRFRGDPKLDFLGFFSYDRQKAVSASQLVTEIKHHTP